MSILTTTMLVRQFSRVAQHLANQFLRGIAPTCSATSSIDTNQLQQMYQTQLRSNNNNNNNNNNNHHNNHKKPNNQRQSQPHANHIMGCQIPILHNSQSQSLFSFNSSNDMNKDDHLQEIGAGEERRSRQCCSGSLDPRQSEIRSGSAQIRIHPFNPLLFHDLW